MTPPVPIEDYALIGDLQAAALVDLHGSIDWLCFPRFDSGACFAALLGTPENGRWLLAPAAGGTPTRRYVPDTMVLETTWENDEGCVRVFDFMPPRGRAPDVVRLVEGVHGSVRMQSELVIRFDYGSVVPWVRRVGADRVAIAGPDALYLRTPAETHGENMHTVSEATVAEGERVPFVLTWNPSHEPAPTPVDAEAALEETVSFWEEWNARCIVPLPPRERELIHRSLMVLKTLTYAPTGGIVAAPTTSLPESPGGVRNWDYRFCWLRDATLTLSALLHAGHRDEAAAWRDWLLRAVAGNPADLQIMYGLAGERRLPEYELPWLSGFAGSAPVRIGNDAVKQLQLDVYGEVLDSLSLARRSGLPSKPHMWAMQCSLLDFLRRAWRQPDEGLWEVRGGRRHFVHSKVMVWVAADRAVRTLEENPSLRGDLDDWRALREDVHREVCAKGYDAERNTFTQSYGSRELDAALLLIPRVGFLPPGDPRVLGTVDAIRAELGEGGLVRRYSTDTSSVDGLPGGEGTFLACSFWLADALHVTGRTQEARELFERLVGLANDVGLLAEEYQVGRDGVPGRQLGNFPQAFSHIGLVNTALALYGGERAGWMPWILD
ncbi:MAG TPA: glycoside hydrolase family 15 protein [Gaiellaceae bacterium]|nr:glycoside hydrolase family 15 protein [Gaiellaceae bacterium]